MGTSLADLEVIYMKRIFASMILLIFVFSTVAIAVSSEAGNTLVAQPRATAAKIQQVQAQQDSRLEVCKKYVEDNDLADDAEETCNKLRKGELKCAEFLEENEVENPEAVCARLQLRAVKARQLLTQSALANAKQTRLRNIEEALEKHPEAEEILQGLSEEKANILAKLTRAQQQRVLSMDKHDAEEALGKYRIKTVKKEDMFKKREIAKQKLMTAVSKYNQALERLKQAKEKYNEHKDKFDEARNRLKECESSDSAECEQLRKETRQHAKEVVVKSGEALIEHLKKLLAKVESAEDMDEDRAEDIIEDLNEAIAELEAAVKQAEAAETKEEIKEAAKTIRDIWKRVQWRERIHAAWLVHAKVWNIIKRSEHLEDRLDDALEKLEEQGYDTSGVEDKIDEFSQKIGDARDKYEGARELISQANDLRVKNATDEEKEQAKELVEQARELLREAHALVKEAHTLLTEILREIRGAGGNIPDEPDDSEELEEEEEESEDEEEDDEGSSGDNETQEGTS
jgi:hypothetical protein